MRRFLALAALLIAFNTFAQRPAAFPSNSDIRELRLGIVCYGGISLAIYMHGNTRELHHLAMASSALECDDVGDDKGDKVVCGNVPQGQARERLPESAKHYYDVLLEKWKADGARTRVVIDVIAGTSAGGINGIFLAKALATNRPLDGLRDIWFREADISRLATGKPWPLRAAWRVLLKGDSALRGDVWLKQLYDTFEKMDTAGTEPRLPSLLTVGQPLDLLVTATDFYGSTHAVEIGDPVMSPELRYDQVFRFSAQRSVEGDVEAADLLNNAALAFAARSSASFPVAFPAMRLDDLREFLGNPNLDTQELAKKVFGDRLAELRHDPDAAKTFAEHLFLVDGGVLDNKPFGIAYDRVSHRSPSPAVETRRVFLYLEPDPADPRKPEVIKTFEHPSSYRMFWQAKAGIPGSEPIAGDLLEINEHNRRVERVREIIRRDEATARQKEGRDDSVAARVEFVLSDNHEGNVVALAEPQTLNAAKNMRQTVEADAAKSNLAVVEDAYQRLRVHSVLEQFARVLSTSPAVCGLPEEYSGIQSSLVREVVFHWAKERKLTGQDVNIARRDAFLAQFDIGYIRRRLRFVNDWLNTQYRPAEGEYYHGLSREQIQDAQRTIQLHIQKLTDMLRGKDANAELTAAFRSVGEAICVEATNRPREQAAELFAKHSGLLDDLALKAGDHFTTKQGEILAELHKAFIKQTGDWKNPPAARAVLARYLGFPYWDRVAYPYTAFNGVGDLTSIAITRFSPEDIEAGNGASKLAGVDFAHFGAFLDAEGRKKDYLWGRLDAAERVLHLLERDQAYEVTKIRNAILIEEKTAVGVKNVKDVEDCLNGDMTKCEAKPKKKRRGRRAAQSQATTASR